MKKRRVRQIEVGSARLCFDYGDVLLDLLLPIICIDFLRKCNSHAEVGSAAQSWGRRGLSANQEDFARGGISRTFASGDPPICPLLKLCRDIRGRNLLDRAVDLNDRRRIVSREGHV